ncbi:hypothetical protein TELCIR_17356, partial [Teladorsagia circumcincta]
RPQCRRNPPVTAAHHLQRLMQARHPQQVHRQKEALRQERVHRQKQAHRQEQVNRLKKVLRQKQVHRLEQVLRRKQVHRPKQSLLQRVQQVQQTLFLQILIFVGYRAQMGHRNVTRHTSAQK